MILQNQNPIHQLNVSRNSAYVRYENWKEYQKRNHANVIWNDGIVKNKSLMVEMENKKKRAH